MASVPLYQTASAEVLSRTSDEARARTIHSASWKQVLTREFIAEWDTLTADVAEPNPFYESWHLSAALEACDPKGAVEIVQFRVDGKLKGLLPLERTSNYYGRPIPHLRGWLHDNAFCGVPLVACDHETAFWIALQRWATEHSRTALFLHLEHLPEDGALFRILSACQSALGPAAIVHRAERALLKSGQSSEDYFNEAMSGKKRKELRRQFNRLSDLGVVEYERASNGADIENWVSDFLALEAAGWKGRENSALASNPDTEQLFRQTMTQGAAAGRVERLALRLNGKPVAMLVNFVSPPGIFSFKTTFDEEYARFSPGVLLQRENLALLDQEHIQWADSCAAADHPMIERIWREKRSVVRVSIGVGGMLRQAAFKQLNRFESGTERLEQT